MPFYDYFKEKIGEFAQWAEPVPDPTILHLMQMREQQDQRRREALDRIDPGSGWASHGSNGRWLF